MKLLKLLVLSFLFIYACTDPCDDVVCQNGGTCDEGTCLCPDGYSGVNCEIFDPCFDVNCQNGGNCIDGNCICERGYIGESCELETRATFIGLWDASWICDIDPTDLNEDVLEIVISNNDILEVILILDEENIFAQVDENGSFIINRQELLSDGDLYFVEGDGKLEGDKLNLEMTIELPAESLITICDFEMTKL